MLLIVKHHDISAAKFIHWYLITEAEGGKALLE